ncbi:MAG: SDR family oxidoreductase [Bacteroidetes bacterium]|nr:SDR family oxidoreductase [Bacteroidota bacterium]
MKDRIVLITGASSGIGLETAKQLAAQGAQLVLVARSEDKLKEAVATIKAQTPSANVKYYIADFSSQKSVRNLAQNITRNYTKLDVLINNAGCVVPEFQLTEDGLEKTIATNHFAYFILTNELLPLVKKSDYARIVNVASGSHYQGKMDFESFTKEKGYFIMKAYAQSKLANVLFTYELAERLKGTQVTVNCLHPGFVKTEIGNKKTNWYSSFFWSLGTMLGGISVQNGAKTSVYLASSPEVKGVSGKYFDKCKAVEPNKDAYNADLRKQLWQVSENFAGSAVVSQ